MKIMQNKLFFILKIMYFIFINTALCQNTENISKNGQINNFFPLRVEMYPKPANIGNFYNGYSGSEIPGEGGNTNNIEITFYTSYNNFVDLIINFENTDNYQNVIIDEWYWDFMDEKSPNIWYDRIYSQNKISKTLKFVKNPNSNCDSWAKARITLTHLTIFPYAKSGMFSLKVYITTLVN